MKVPVLLVSLLISSLISCDPKPVDTATESGATTESTVEPAQDVALRFVNDYLNFCMTNDSELKSINWIRNNEFVTATFKTSHQQLIENARQADEEMGLGFDPIFNAQDYPEGGFEFSNADSDGYVTLIGKDWKEFTVVVKMKLVDNKWRVDGAGAINIPEDKQPG